MKYCSNCGYQVNDDMKFCPSCGAKLTLEETVASSTTQKITVNVNDLDNVYKDCSVVLTSLGSCATSYADDVIEDVIGYSDSQARRLIRYIPCDVAINLTKRQALYVAQALSEYGMEVIVLDGNKIIDIDDYASSSIYDAFGNYVFTAGAILATISATNRVSKIIRREINNVVYHVFTPTFTRITPPVHRRRTPMPSYFTPKRNQVRNNTPAKPNNKPVNYQPVQGPNRSQPSKPTQTLKGGANNGHGGPKH